MNTTKRILTVLALAIGLTAASYLALPVDEVHCAYCSSQGGSCTYDIDCQIGCVCIKRPHKLTGVCF